MLRHLFVYGTLAPGGPNEHLLTRIGGRFVSATVRGRLYNAGWGATGGYPGIVPDESASPVPGYIFESDGLESHWAKLDAFEGDEYERISVCAELADGTPVPVFVYAIRK